MAQSSNKKRPKATKARSAIWKSTANFYPERTAGKMLSECGAANRNSYREPGDLPLLNMSSLSNRSPRMDQLEQAAVLSVMNSHVSGLEFVDVFGPKWRSAAQKETFFME